MMTFVLASLYYSTILAALAYTGYLLTNRWRPDVTHKLQLVAQERGLHAASWLVALAYRQVCLRSTSSLHALIHTHTTNTRLG